MNASECCTPNPRIPVSPTSRNVAGSLNAYLDYDPHIRETRGAISVAGRLTGALDPLMTELVRLRNGGLQGCHF